MEIIYKDTHDFSANALENLFLSVDWSSGHYPEKLVVATKHISMRIVVLKKVMMHHLCL